MAVSVTAAGLFCGTYTLATHALHLSLPSFSTRVKIVASFLFVCAINSCVVKRDSPCVCIERSVR